MGPKINSVMIDILRLSLHDISNVFVTRGRLSLLLTHILIGDRAERSDGGNRPNAVHGGHILLVHCNVAGGSQVSCKGVVDMRSSRLVLEIN